MQIITPRQIPEINKNYDKLSIELKNEEVENTVNETAFKVNALRVRDVHDNLLNIID